MLQGPNAPDQMKIRSSRDDGEFKRGEAVTLNCSAAICTIHQLEVTWFRDGHALSESGPTLHLSNLTAKDSGNYTCGLKKKNRTLSVPYSLHVEADEAEEAEEGYCCPRNPTPDKQTKMDRWMDIYYPLHSNFVHL
uniref:Ig-like domain-containing protein n=1 Tax=Sander lucioperca TaxID=283035 RepID=A0A8C9XFB8_SANLU